MKFSGVISVVSLLTWFNAVSGQCSGRESLSFTRWSGVAPGLARPVFVYSASGDEASLTGACLARCRELDACAAVAVAFGAGTCQGIAASQDWALTVDSDAAFFQKTCLELPPSCARRWWVLEATPGYQLLGARRPAVNATLLGCGAQVFSADGDDVYRSAQWVGPDGPADSISAPGAGGGCLLAAGDRFTEPEAYRVGGYHTVYLENQCRHDYSKKIDRCSYEEYFNQTLRHVELTIHDFTKDQCKSACETEDRFVCRGFTWSLPQGRGRSLQGQGEGQGQGVCDLHSEDLVSTGSWLLRRTNAATYYRRVICLNISVECTDTSMSIRYRPRGSFTGRVYVPGRGEQCSARAMEDVVTLDLPLYGDCDVHFAHAVDQRPGFPANRTMAYVMLMIQNNPIIQTAGDRWVRVGCTPAAAAGAHSVDAVVAVTDPGKPSLSTDPYLPMAASSVLNNSQGAPLSLYVVRTHDAPRVQGAALGEPLELRLETTEESEIEAYHLVASSRLGDSSVLLLDSQGCPTGQVDFPPFTRSRAGGTQRLAARFKAFRFPTSHVVRFSLMVRYCGGKCAVPNCAKMNRAARETNDTNESSEETISYTDGENGVSASIREDSGWSAASPPLVVAQGGVANGCGEGGALELEMMVGGKDLLTADTLVHADHRSTMFDEERRYPDAALVCVHELLLVCVALAWLAIQLLLLIGCCVLVKRYRNLAEMSMQKDYHSFDNVGFDTVSTHRRVHWPDQSVDILHTT